MGNPESNFTRNLNKDIRKINPDIYTLKIMTYGNSGVPDCWASGNISDIWYENKWITLPKRDTTPIVPNLSALQLDWLAKRQDQGIEVAVIVGSKEGCCIMVDHRRWEMPHFRTDFILTRKDVAQWIVNWISG